MKLEAVVTCVNYGDFLAHTLPYNKFLFDSLVVVTAPEDKLTRRVCEFHHVKCVLTDKFQSHWGKFCKGAGINVGLAELERSDWVMQLDADIALPPMFRRVLETADLDKSCLYGVDRFMVPSFDAWTQFMACPALQHENGSWLHPTAFQLGTRVWLPHAGGYVPIGFFQMWNAASGLGASYPDRHATAARGDIQFAGLWPRSKRHMIPEIIAYHLESEAAAHGANWNGRITNQFGPDPVFRPPVSSPKGQPDPTTDETQY